MIDLSTLSDDELMDLLDPLTRRLGEIADMYEFKTFSSLSIGEVDREALEVSDKSLAIQGEFSRRYPESHSIQQAYRASKLLASRLIGRENPFGPSNIRG